MCHSRCDSGEEALRSVLPYGLAVRIPGFHPGGPGSTPGVGRHFCCEKSATEFGLGQQSLNCDVFVLV